MLDEIKEYMEKNQGRMVELQKILTAIPAIAPENNGDGESKKAEVLLNWLKNTVFNNIEVYEAPDNRVSSGVRPSIVVTVPGLQDQNIWLMAHLDVVPPGKLSSWDTDPWECVEKDGKLYGRGCEDNQQGLVSSVFAALYYIENKITPKYTIKLLFVADEENGSKKGCIWLTENTDLFKSDDMIIIPDSGDKKGETIEITEKHITWIKFQTIGKQVHGSNPDGRNAFLANCDLAVRLNKLEKRFNKIDNLFNLPYSTIQPTKHEANVESVNIIPGEDIFYVDCRIIPYYSLDEFFDECNKICDDIEKEYGVKINYSLVQKVESKKTPEDASIVKILSNTIKETHNQDTKIIGISGGTVAGHLRRNGIDCVVWSTLDSMAHNPNEYCIIKNMIKDSITLAMIFNNS